MGRGTNINIAIWGCVVATVTVALELLVGSFPVNIFRFPVNILTMVLWGAMLGIIYKQRTTSAIARFMLSSEAMWLSFTLMAAMGIYLGLEHKPSSDAWPAVVALLFILSNLTLITLRGWRNTQGIRWRFTLLHLGLILALGAGFWGAPDREQLRIAIDSTPSDQAYTMAGEPRLLDYELSLVDACTEYGDDGTPHQFNATIMVDGVAATISVNHPYDYSWMEKIYLISISDNAGAEPYCIVEVVREPWQWLSMTGIVMLIVGAVLMFLGGPRRGGNEITTKEL